MKRKGFTLIELLAVIIILAVIAVITTPIVTKTIENSKKATAIESAGSLIQSAEYYFVSASPKYGKLDVLSDKLNYKGEKPELGEVEIDKQGKSRLYVYINGYCVTKEYGSELYANKTGKENCNWYGTDNYETTDGTTFTLNNQSVKNYLIYGNSTQETRSGKNIFNPSAWSTSVTGNGLTIQYLADEDCFLINGTATATHEYLRKYINLPSEVNTSYVLSTQYVSGSVDRTNGEGGKWAVAYFGKGDTENTSTNWYAIDLENSDATENAMINDKNYITSFWFYINKGITFNNYKVRIQLEKGTSATSYEKYGAMPSPEFPSEIRSTGDLLTSSNCSSYGSDACNNVGKYVIQVKNRGKNLIDVDNFISTFNQYKYAGIKTTKTTFDGYDCMKVYGSLSIEGRNVQYLKNQFKDNTQYTFSMSIYDLSSGANDLFGISGKINYTDGTVDRFTPVPPSRKFGEWQIVKVTSKANKTIDHISFNYGTGYAYSYIKNWQIEEGSSATEYETYKEAVTNIYLDEPLRKVGDYADYIDFDNKKIVRNVKEILFNGTEILTKVDTNALKTDYIYPEMKAINSTTAIYYISNHAPSTTPKYITTYNQRDGYRTSIEFRNILEMWKVEYDVDVFKQWLAKQSISGNPVTIDYVLDTPSEESIDLPDIKTLDGTSTLQVNTTVSPSNVKLTTNK